MKNLTWGPRSKSYLNPKILESLLIELANAVLFEKGFDHSVIKSLREKEEQNSLYYARPKKTKVKWPDSYHNVDGVIRKKSWAIDVIPYPFSCWPDPETQRPKIYAKDLARMYSLIAVYRSTAMEKGILIITGSDWDNDWNFRDQNFDDIPHVQLASLERLKSGINESEYNELVEKASNYDKIKNYVAKH